jgi:serine protease
MSDSSKSSGVSRQRLNSLLLLQLMFFAACLLSRPVSAAGEELDSPVQFIPQLPKHYPDQIIVRFGQDVDQDIRDQIIAQHNCYIIRTCEPGDVHLLSIPESETAEAMAENFFEHDEVEYAELNHIIRVFFVPDDPYYHYQWNFYNDITGGIQTDEAWSIETGDPNVIVAVLDTGVAYENYDIYKLASDLAETLFVPGYDFINDDNHPNDDHGHGTHVTGTIAQSTNNDIGVAGIAYGCSIMPVKVLDANGAGSYFTITEGIYFAVENGAMVINMSLGATSPSDTLEDALAYAYQNGVTVVCAAGNDYQNGNPVEYPAAYDDYCIAVGATRFDNQRAPYSSTGSYLDVVAPGGDMLVDQNGDGYPDGIVQQTFSVDPNDFAYYFFQGTSMATPHVSGLAALLISYGVQGPDNVRQAIQTTAIDLGPEGWDPEYGWGLINAEEALEGQSEQPDVNGP